MLALDVGVRRIGMAVSDPMGILASPRGYIERKGMAADVNAVVRKARELGAETVLVGMPLTLKGKKGMQAQLVDEFCQRLEEDGGVQVSTWDERFSTFDAESRMRAAGRKPSREKGRSDAAAAAVILQSYLDSRRSQ